MKNRTNLWLMILVILATLLPRASAQDDSRALDLSSLTDIVVMAEGRMKPLPTFARERFRDLLGPDAQPEGEPFDNFVSLLFEGEAWADRPCLITGEALAETCFEGKTLLSPAEVFQAHRTLSPIIQEGRASKNQPGPLAEQAMSLLNRAFALNDLSIDFLFMPFPGENPDVWVGPGEMRSEQAAGLPELAAGLQAFEALGEAYRSGDQQRLDQAAADLKAFQRKDAGRVLSPGLVALENAYYSLDLKMIGLLLFSLSTLFYLLWTFIRKPGFHRLALLILILGALWNCWIIGGRTAIGGRLPLKNLQEVYLVVLFFVPLIGMLLQWLFKSPLYSGFAAALSVIGFIGALNLAPHGYDIAPLMAILISPWRQVHILTIMLSYAILLVSAGLHIGFLVLAAFQRRNEPEGYSEVAEDLHHKAYLVLMWGELFLTVGIATGAAWAHSSWGRYWGWDPKEVWATIAWAIYLLFLHLRVFTRTPKVWLATVNLVGFAAILFTYFGVTYLLPGLHAYK